MTKRRLKNKTEKPFMKRIQGTADENLRSRRLKKKTKKLSEENFK